MHGKYGFGSVFTVGLLTLGINVSAYAGDSRLVDIKSVEGAQLYKRYECSKCHGDDGKSAVKPGIPDIAGLSTDYLAKAMKKMGTEVRPDRHKPMQGDAGGCEEPMSDAEMRAISTWLGSLKLSSVSAPSN